VSAGADGAPLIVPLRADDVAARLDALAALLVATVDDGASIGFHAPLAAADAARYWRGVQAAVHEGERVVLAAVDGRGTVLGTGQLALEARANGRHRAEVQKVMVAPAARRRGIARALMLALEDAARAAGRTLLVLDTREGDAAAALYAALGWTLAGRVPGYVLERDGTYTATLIFYRALGG
jgi:ribosomal protein S18 acetylase RimI-like enzyme